MNSLTKAFEQLHVQPPRTCHSCETQRYPQRLAEAIHAHNVERVAELLRTHPHMVREPNARFLEDAVSLGNPRIAQMICSAGADVSHVTPEGYSLLHIAAARGHVFMIDMLHRYGGNVNAPRCNSFPIVTPLHTAIAKRQRDAIVALIERGAEIDNRAILMTTCFDGELAAVLRRELRDGGMPGLEAAD